MLPKINLCLEGSGERDDVIARYHCWSQGTAWWERSPFHLAITHATVQVSCPRRPEIQINRLARLRGLVFIGSADRLRTHLPYLLIYLFTHLLTAERWRSLLRAIALQRVRGSRLPYCFPLWPCVLRLYTRLLIYSFTRLLIELFYSRVKD